MTLDTSKIKAVIFDYGNTLIEFGPEQVQIHHNALLATLSELFGPCDKEKFTTIRKRQILAPYETDKFIENNREGICKELIEELYGITPDEKQIKCMLDKKHKTFVNSVKRPDFVIPLLQNLQKHYRLAFISNFPCLQSVVGSLKKLELFDIFESVVVSGEMGVVKPHPAIFERSLEELNLDPEDCVYVGDNWLADIQGAKRIGMQAIHTTQYVSYENFQPFDGDFPPDAVISHLNQLEKIMRKQ